MFSALRKLRRRAAWWLDRDRHERELREEIEAHAAARGRRDFGNATRVMERSRAVWIPSTLEAFAQDVRYGVRQLAHDPLFTAASLTGLAIALGLVTLILSFVNAIFWRPLPVKHGDRVARIMAVHDTGRGKWGFSRDEAAHYREAGAFEALVSAELDDRVAADWKGSETSRAITAQVDGFFEFVGGEPLRGRYFGAGEREPVAVITEQAWKRKWNSDPAVVGRVLHLNKQPFTVVGVVPDKTAAILDAPVDLLIPAGFDRALGLAGGVSMRLLGRWAEDATLERTQAAMDVAAARWFAAHPEIETRYRIQVSPARLSSWKLNATDRRQEPLLLLGAVFLVLLIACINLTNLMLARAESRRREIGARLALGAGRMRLVRQLLTECLVMTALAGAVGLALSHAGARAFLSWLNGAMPASAQYLWIDTSIDWRILLGTLAVCAATAAITGLSPAREALKTDLLSALRSGAGTAAAGGGGFGRRVRSALIVLQLAACSTLLLATASLTSALGVLERQLLGLDAKPVISVPLPLTAYDGYQTLPAATNAMRRITEAVRALPGVSAAGLSAFPMMIVLNAPKELEVEGNSGPNPRTSQIMGIGDGTLSAMALGPVRGRDFASAESTSQAPVAIVNERFARDLWPGGDHRSKHIRLDPAKPWLEVVGVARDIGDREGGMAQYQIYVPQEPTRVSYLMVRAAADRDRLLAPIRAAIERVDPKIVPNPSPLESIVNFVSLGPKLASTAARVVAAVALLMAAIGLYGVTAYTAARRTHEIGIRMTLGARRVDVLGLVFRQGAVLVAAGVLVGAAGGYAVEAAMASWLEGLESLPLWAYGLTGAFQAMVACAAILEPSWRATRVDPLDALRHD